MAAVATKGGERLTERTYPPRAESSLSHPLWRDAIRRRMLAAADVAAVLLAVTIIRQVLHVGGDELAWFGVLLPVWIILAKVLGLYDTDHRRIGHLTTNEIPALSHWSLISVVLIGLFLTLKPGHAPLAGELVVLWAMMLVLAFSLRAVARMSWRHFMPREATLVLGNGDLARDFKRKLTLEPGHHVEVTQHSPLNGDAERGHSVGPVTEVDQLLAGGSFDRVIVASEELEEEQLAEVVRTCRANGVKLSVASPLRAMLGTAVGLSHLGDLPLVEFKGWDIPRSTMLIKRTIDVTISAISLMLLAPVLATIAVLIKLDSPGGVFFVQRRAGLGGVPFPMIKFRTMVANAENSLASVIDLDHLSEPVFKLRADPRVTRLGRALRKSSLDELPQLVNVLLGYMSLVGPRPEELRLVDRYSDAERFRLEMRPGMTGPMQVHGRGELTFQERLAIEREYIENYTLHKDFDILLRTVGTVVTRKGAY